MLPRARSWLRNTDGTVSVIGALTLPAVIGAIALAVEFGHGLVTRAENQRVADLAAFAGALAYNSTSSTSSMTEAANAVAVLNGIPAAKVKASLVTSPKTASSQAVTVEIATSNVLFLAPVLGGSSTLPIETSAFVELGATTPACIIALNSAETGVTLSGGTAITAPECAVASNNTVSVPCGTSITTKAVNYNSAAAPSQPCSGIKAPSGKTLKIAKTATTDPLSGNGAVASAKGHLSSVASQTSPTVAAAAAGTSIEFGWSTSATQNAAKTIGCTATWTSGTSTWAMTCPNDGTYNFGTVTVGGGIKVQFNTAGTAKTTYNFGGLLTLSGSTWTFGPGVYNITKGLSVGGGTTVTFGAGTYNIGAMAAACNGGVYSICHTGTALTFGGPSAFTVASGIYVGGGSAMTVGSGTTNTYDIGASGNGFAVNINGGSSLSLADATGTFKATGNIVSAGGSCLTLPAASQHDIKGYLSASGGVILGSGVWTLNDYFALGASGGGNVTCNGTSVGVSGSNVTIVTAATTTPASGTCKGAAFCVGSGYSNVTLTAPTSGSTAKLVVVNATTAGAVFTQGASNSSLSGVFYFPSGPITLSGGATIGNGAGQCLQLIGSRVTLTGGTAAASACITNSSSAGGVVLVQ
jgi:hypothetical protein